MTTSSPRLLLIDLALLAEGAEARPEPWTPTDDDLARAAPWAGGALAGMVLLERARRGLGEGFGVAVGDGVRRGLPTAARATVAARSPLTAGLSEGLVGGDLGRRLARVADAIVLFGSAGGSGGVVVVDPHGRAIFQRLPELCGLDPAATHAALVERFGPCATLRVGPAAERGVAIASLASGGEAASFVGRGGLGAAFAARGLKALVVQAPEVETQQDLPLVQALLASPRLAARAAGGTFELGAARRARGEIDHSGDELAVQAEAAPRERVGCRGCPTPCGWAFERPDARALPARFGKVWNLGPPLGLEDLDDALALAATCDEVGVDAKEAGAGLARLADLHGARGDRARLQGFIEDLGRGSGPGWEMAAGQATEAPGAESGIAARLGARVSSNGADPMRTFPFLLEAGGRERLVRLLDGVPLPERAEDPSDPRGKGRIVWWHENLVAGLDLVGFCAFSAAGLLADGVLSLEQLAAHLLPLDLANRGRAGRTLLDAGATVVAFRRELVDLWDGSPARVEDDLRDALLDYERWRNLGWAAGEGERTVSAVPAPDSPAHVEPGDVVLCSQGPLAEKLGPRLCWRLERPTALGDLLERIGGERGAALVEDGLLVASVYRAGRRLDAADPVSPGDQLDLVLAIAGG